MTWILKFSILILLEFSIFIPELAATNIGVLTPKTPANEMNCTTNNATQAIAITISGSVIDENGNPLTGVNILVKGADKGTATDSEGKFTLEDVDENAVLIVSYIGYETQEVQVKGITDLTITLVSDTQLLDEVVVVGYGTQNRGNLTGSVASVSARELEDRPITSFSEAMSGQLAGVQIKQTSSEPGGGISIKIRGTGSITAGNSPLYVVDGVPLDNSIGSASAQGTGLQSPVNPLASLNPADIESIDVLKDASATAIYGSRGSNGVVIIKTKSGVAGKPSIQFNVSTAWQDISNNKIEVKSLAEFAQTQMDAINNSWIRAGGSASDPNSERPAGRRIPLQYSNPSNETGTDWQDEVFRVAPMQNYQLSASGGSENIRYHISGNYLDQDGIVVNSGYKKYGFRSNIDADVTDKIHVGLRISPSLANYNISRTQGIPYSGGMIAILFNTNPFYKPYNEDGSYATSFIWDYGDGDTRRSNYTNPLANAFDIDRKLSQFNTIGSLFATVDLMDNLVFSSRINLNFNTFNKDVFYPSTIYLNGAAPPRNPTAESFSSRSINWANENTLTFDNTFANDHNLKVLAGFTEQKSTFHSSGLSASGFPNDRVHTLNAGTINGGSTFSSEWTLLSAFGRINYNYKSKYLITATARSDGSSRFGADNKWGFFPSGSVGWRITGEEFMNSAPDISELKLRASFGYTGNFQIPDYAAIGLVSGSNYILGTGSGSISNGLTQNSISNPDLSWEKAKEYDLGLELGLYNNRIYFTADYYNKTTFGLLLDVPVPFSTGYSTALRNIGEVSNKGLELALKTYNIDSENVRWSTNFNISFNKNRVEALGLNDDPILIGPRDVNNTLSYKTAVGEPIGSFYGYIYDGVFKDEAEVEAYPHFNNTTPGDAKFRDVNNDGVINTDDKTIIGNNVPDFIFGFSSRLSVNNFDLNVVLQGLKGAQVFNYMVRSATYRRLVNKYSNYWKSPDEPGDGMFKPGGLGTNRSISSWYVEDGSYLRIKNITLSYNVPQVGNLFKTAKVYVSVENLHTFTPYSGFNPDVNTVAGSSYRPDSLQPGLDYGTYPAFRTLALGLNISF